MTFDHDPKSPDSHEIRIALAEIRGQLSKTPGSLELFLQLLGVCSLLVAVFSGLLFVVFQYQQSAFKDTVIAIIEKREFEQQIKINALFREYKSFSTEPNNDEKTREFQNIPKKD